MSTTTDALEPELERSAPAEAVSRFHYPARPVIVARIVAGVLLLPLVVALILRTTGFAAFVALIPAIAGGWLFFQVQRRLAERPQAVVVAQDGLSLTGTPQKVALRWTDITHMHHSRVRRRLSFGIRANAAVLSIDSDLDDLARFLRSVTRCIDASRRETSDGEPQQRRAGGDSLFRRPLHGDITVLAISLTGIMLGLLVQPLLLVIAALSVPLLLWRFATLPYSVVADDTAVWIIRPLARDVVPLRAIRDASFAIAGRIPGPAVTIDHRDRGTVVISGMGAATLPLFDAVSEARLRARAAARTGPAATRSGSDIRNAGSRRQMLLHGGGAAAACVAVVWIAIFTGIPLRTATRHGSELVARTLLLMRSPVETTGRDGMTALHHAALLNETGIARALLDRGADPDARASASGSAALHFAAASGRLEIVGMLVSAGADANAPAGDGRTPLALAAFATPIAVDDDTPPVQHDTAIARMLLGAGADPDVADESGRSPLHHSAAGNRATLIRQLARARADVDAADARGDRPLHVAAAAGHFDAIDALLDAGADVDARGSGGRTAIASAADAGASAAVVNALLAAGAGAGVPDDDGWNAVQLAARANNVPMLELFARRRASLNATDGRIAPALWLAADNGHTDAARALLRGGASPYIRWNGRSALDVAISKRNATLVALMQMR